MRPFLYNSMYSILLSLFLFHLVNATIVCSVYSILLLKLVSYIQVNYWCRNHSKHAERSFQRGVRSPSLVDMYSSVRFKLGTYPLIPKSKPTITLSAFILYLLFKLLLVILSNPFLSNSSLQNLFNESCVKASFWIFAKTWPECNWLRGTPLDLTSTRISSSTLIFMTWLPPSKIWRNHCSISRCTFTISDYAHLNFCKRILMNRSNLLRSLAYNSY